MATLLSHQHQLQQSNQLLFNAPNNVTNHPGHHNHHHHHHLNSHQGGHFCKDCGVMFESSTSLEVHLSYHKENLLTRWANQDALDKSSNSSSGSHYANPSSPSPNKRDVSRSDNSSVESNSSSQYYQPLEPAHFLPPLYNNNTGDQHMQPSPTTPTYRTLTSVPIPSSNGGSSGFLLSHQPQPPVDSNTPMLYESFNPNFQPSSSQHGQQIQLPGGHPLFSPSTSSNEHHHQAPPQQQQQQPAEILDLDSHKVHIYQHPHQQQFFHRPYLNHLLPPLPPQQTQSNGWPNEHHFSSRFSPAYTQLEPPPHQFYAPAPILPPPTAAASNSALPPTTTNNGTTPSSFEIVRMENPNYQQGIPPGHQSPYAPPHPSVESSRTIIKREKPSPSSSSASGALPKGQRSSPLQSGNNNNNNNNNNKTGQSSGVKTKGWKGGECKRPKTYNCPACNKWFTSSGHLKRHYGTTLHKNSMKQLGDSAEELFKQQPKKKGPKSNSGEPKTPKQPKKGGEKYERVCYPKYVFF